MYNHRYGLGKSYTIIESCTVLFSVLPVLDICSRGNSRIKENKSIAVSLFNYKSCGNADEHGAMKMRCREERSNWATGLEK